MFGLDKLKLLKKQAEEVKSRLDDLRVLGESYDGLVKVEVNGNKNVLSIDINQSVLNVRTKQEIDKVVMEAVNNALDAAQKAADGEMKGMLPNIPGLGI